MVSKCSCRDEIQTQPVVSSVEFSRLLQLHSANLATCATLARASVPAGNQQMHLMSDGSFLVSSSHADAENGSVVLTGSIGPLPYEIHLTIHLEASVVTVTVQLIKPIPIGPFTWTYHLGGLPVGPNGGLTSASITVQDVKSPPGVAATGLNWLCFLKCGGATILSLLLKCLPSLAGGTAAFVACVTAGGGAGAAEIAVCIATKCL